VPQRLLGLQLDNYGRLDLVSAACAPQRFPHPWRQTVFKAPTKRSAIDRRVFNDPGSGPGPSNGAGVPDLVLANEHERWPLSSDHRAPLRTASSG